MVTVQDKTPVVPLGYHRLLLLLITVAITCLQNALSSPVGVWHDGVDSGRGHRLFSCVCSLLGDVFCHPVLDSDHLPVCSLPYWSSQQDTAGALACTGKTPTH